MRRPMGLAVAAASAVMLAAGWRAGTAQNTSVTLSDPATGTPGDSSIVSPTPAPSPGSTTATTGPTTAPAGPTGTFIGASIDTSYGSFQVQIVVDDGTITDVQPLVIGLSDSKSRRINADAVPALEARVLAAQSANVSYVSGASYTSQGYLDSVADAMANAGI